MSELEPNQFENLDLSHGADPDIRIYVEGLQAGFREGDLTIEDVLESILVLYWEERHVADRATRNYIAALAYRFPMESGLGKSEMNRIYNEVESRYIKP